MFRFRQRGWYRQAGICLAALTVLFMCSLPAAGRPPSKGNREQEQLGTGKASALSGPTIQVDPGFRYYQNRSAASIADEIVQNGYKSVRYFVVNENQVNRELVEAFQERGLFVWALVLGNGSYSVEGFPADWPSWQMELLTPVNDGYYRFSRIAKLMRSGRRRSWPAWSGYPVRRH